MTIRTCLLVTDDPDDHHAISEAIAQISEKTVVLNILDSQKALMLLKESSYQPDYLFLDLSMHGIRINSLLKIARKEGGTLRMPVIVYGSQEIFDQITDHNHIVFFNKDYQYSELLAFLKTFFNSSALL